MISYAGLLEKLKTKKLTMTALTTQLGIASRTITKIERGEKSSVVCLRKSPRSSAALQMRSAEPFQTTPCSNCFAMRKASVCRAACITSFKSA